MGRQLQAMIDVPRFIEKKDKAEEDASVTTFLIQVLIHSKNYTFKILALRAIHGLILGERGHFNKR